MTAADDIVIRLLDPHEAGLVVDAIRAAYGDTYDVPWLYDAREITRRLAQGRMVSAGAFAPEGSLLCHAALTRHDHDDQVVHSGQAVSLPAARGHHLFTRVKEHLAHWCRERAVLGIYSEATAAHPYSQKANLDLGATETGVLLAWIPATVDNDASVLAQPTRASVVLFYLRTSRAPAHPVYVPPVYRDVVHSVVARGGLRGALAHASPRLRIPPHTRIHTEIDDSHNTAIVHVHEIGGDLAAVLAADRDRLFARGVDVVYVDLRLEHPASEVVGDAARDAGFRFAGVFPSPHHPGENCACKPCGPGSR